MANENEEVPVNGSYNVKIKTFNNKKMFTLITLFISGVTSLALTIGIPIYMQKNKVVDCGYPPLPSFGTVSVDKTISGSQGIYQCITGYVINGPAITICNTDGEWDGLAPICKNIDCGTSDLHTPIHGSLSYGKTDYNSTARFACHGNFTRMVGPKERVCLENGTWSEYNPKCIWRKDCADWYKIGYTNSGVYTIHIQDNTYKDVYCDMATDGGGWTVIQRRIDGVLSFRQPWSLYKLGFGNLTSEHWLGNEYVSMMTSGTTAYTLRIEVEAFDAQTGYAQYDSFKVANETYKYKLTIGSYNGTLGDGGFGLLYQENQYFTTIDQDNDPELYTNCAVDLGGGGFWFHNCHKVKPNGLYSNFAQSDYKGIVWFPWRNWETMERSKMLFRPVSYLSDID